MMTRMNRLLTTLLAAVLMLNIALPGLEQLPLDWLFRSALAEENAASAPTWAFSLAEAPLGEEQTSGEWRYALREGDGYAVITGYEGTDVHPVVPLMLEDADVVGIADGAFSHAPEAVTLHGNILLIGEDAFSGAKPVIHALNGSYALYWAEGHACAWANDSAGVFQPDVVDFTDVPGGRVYRRGDSYVMLGMLEAQRVSVGSIFWMEDARGTVFFYRITALTEQNGMMLATVEVPEVGDAIRELELTQTVDLTAGDFVPAEGVTQVTSRAVYTEPIALCAGGDCLSGVQRVQRHACAESGRNCQHRKMGV